MNIDTFHPLTLNWYFGTLTIVWVVPLSDIKLTPMPRFLGSTILKHSELDKEPSRFQPKILNPYLYHFSYLAEDLTTANFDRNQLSPVSIGFSPLSPGYKSTCS